MIRIILVCLALILCACTTTQTKPLVYPVTIDSNKAYAMIQYIYKDEDLGDLTMTFGDSESKTLKITVKKNYPTETGVLFEVPPSRRMKLFNISAYFDRPWNVDGATDEFTTVPGKVVHIGIYSFNIKDNILYMKNLDSSKTNQLIESAAKFHGISKVVIIPPIQNSNND